MCDMSGMTEWAQRCRVIVLPVPDSTDSPGCLGLEENADVLSEVIPVSFHSNSLGNEDGLIYWLNVRFWPLADAGERQQFGLSEFYWRMGS